MPVLFTAWALADMARYPFYAASLLGSPPGWLTWLRCALSNRPHLAYNI